MGKVIPLRSIRHRYVTIHGIGNAKPDYNDKWGVADSLGVPRNMVEAVWYEDIMEAHWSRWLVKTASKALALYHGSALAGFAEKPTDYLQDIFVFFLSKAAREAIAERIKLAMSGSDTVTLLGHSLGSIIAYWFCLTHPKLAPRIELVTLGSPLGSPSLERVVKHWMKKITGLEVLLKPEVEFFSNIYSVCDPLSGKIEDLGCDVQVGLTWDDKVFHRQVNKYVAAYSHFLFPPDGETA